MSGETADAPENRTLRSFWGRLSREAEEIGALAGADGEEEAAARAEQCATRLARLARAAGLDGAGEDGVGGARTDPTAWTLPPTARAAARPDYAAVFRARDRWRASLGFSADAPDVVLDAREMWRLYETWCLFQTLDALGALGFRPARGAAPPGALYAVRESRLLWTLAPGAAWAVRLIGSDGRAVSVAYRRFFAEGRESVSHAMQPDITLASGERLWVLDAKFKPYCLPGEEGGDINQMHAYRDGIVDRAHRTHTRVVARAWCLYAGLADAPNRPRLTYTPDPDPAVGALCLRPQSPANFDALCALLSLWLSGPS